MPLTGEPGSGPANKACALGGADTNSPPITAGLHGGAVNTSEQCSTESKNCRQNIYICVFAGVS